jgi:hypothetical protein
MHVWFEGYELVIMAWRIMLVVGPKTLSATFKWRGVERGFLLHPRQSCWL